MGNQRTGLLIIRASIEVGSAEPLRAQVRVTGDVAEGIERTVNLASADDVGALVDAWLQSVLDGSTDLPTDLPK